MKKFHHQRRLRRSYWRITRVAVALVVVFQIILLQHLYIRNIQVYAEGIDEPYLSKLVKNRGVENSSSMRMVFMGDIMMDRSIGRSILSGGDPFKHVSDKLSEYDVRIGNIETTIADPSFASQAAKPYTFNSPIDSLRILQKVKMDISSLANNHTGDFGRPATADTIKQFFNAGLTSVGAGNSVEEAFAPKFIEQGGIKIAFIAQNDIELSHTKVAEGRPGSAYLDKELIEKSIKTAQDQGADVIVSLVHWGVEYSPFQSARQTKWAHFMIDSGVDLVIGGHPHVIQPTETYKGKQIVYSIGNFIFDGMSGDALNGQMIAVEVIKDTVTTGKIVINETVTIGQVEPINYHINSKGFPVLN